MPPKKRTSDNDVNPSIKRKKKKNDDLDDFDVEAGGDVENNGADVGEYDVVSEESLYFC